MASMREVLIAVAIFACLAAASLVSLAVSNSLPPEHRKNDTSRVVRLPATLFVVMTAIVLGLMVNSARNTFESIDHNVRSYAADMILLDRTLRQYGPEAAKVRQPLVAYLQRVIGEPSGAEIPAANKLSELLLKEVDTRLSAITPVDAAHGSLLQDAHHRLKEMLELRRVLVEQSEGSIPRLLIAMLVAWLVLIFASFGFGVPRNAITISTCLVSAALIAATFYLIMDMDMPFAGPIQISLKPLERALAELKG